MPDRDDEVILVPLTRKQLRVLSILLQMVLSERDD